MVTNKTEYLLFILIHLARKKDNNYVSSRKIAEAEDIPVKYIPQLVSILSKKGWLDSARGANGGVRLAINPGEITVLDVARASDEDFYFKNCLHNNCLLDKKDSCELYPFWNKIQAGIETMLQEKTIADLVEARQEEQSKLKKKTTQ